jgi:hypothetical protein
MLKIRKSLRLGLKSRDNPGVRRRVFCSLPDEQPLLRKPIKVQYSKLATRCRLSLGRFHDLRRGVLVWL